MTVKVLFKLKREREHGGRAWLLLPIKLDEFLRVDGLVDHRSFALFVY